MSCAVLGSTAPPSSTPDAAASASSRASSPAPTASTCPRCRAGATSPPPAIEPPAPTPSPKSRPRPAPRASTPAKRAWVRHASSPSTPMTAPSPPTQELPRQPRRLLGGGIDLLEIGPQRLLGLQLLDRHAGQAQDHRQQVVEVVGHPAGQVAHRLHLLGLPEVRLDLLQAGHGLVLVGEILRDLARPHDASLRVPEGRDGERHLDRRPVPAQAHGLVVQDP